MTTDEQTARAIAQVLHERAPTPRGQIERIVECCGAEQAHAWLRESQEIEANGGMLTRDGSRRRTPGGVYLYLVRQRLRQAQRHDDLRRIFGRPMLTSIQPENAHALTPPAAPTWEDRGTLVEHAREQSGKVTRVKITIIGRPGRTVERPQFTLLMLTDSGPLPSLPKGIPVPAQLPETTYIVYIGAKQWRNVKDAVTNPDDILIVEGVPIYDAQYGAITVFATNTTTKALQQAKKQAK